MKLFIFIIISQSLFSQESFYNIDGADFFPDTATIHKKNIIKIQRIRASYIITKKDTSELTPLYRDDFFFNARGLTDSIITWSGDDDNPVLRIDRQIIISDTTCKWAESHYYEYYGSFSSGRGGNHWSGGKSQWHYYRMLKNATHKFPKHDSTLVLKIKADTSKTSYFIEKFEFYENGVVKKDSSYTIDQSGIESILVRYHFHNEKGNLSKIVKYNFKKPGVYVLLMKYNSCTIKQAIRLKRFFILTKIRRANY